MSPFSPRQEDRIYSKSMFDGTTFGEYSHPNHPF